MKVVIPAAGLGTRFLPVTKSLPKEMLPVINRPVIQFVVEEAVAAGGDDITIITGRGKRAIEDHFDRSPDFGDHIHQGELRELDRLSECATIHFVRQREPTGLASALLCAERHVGSDSFGVLLGDSLHEGDPPVLTQLERARDRFAPGGAAVALERVPDDLVDHYGIVGGTELEPGFVKVDRLVEKPSPSEAPSHLALTGAYFLGPAIFATIRATPPGARGEVELTDALNRLARETPMVGVVVHGRRYDTGTPALWLETNLRFALRSPELRGRLLEVIREESTPSGPS